MFEVADLSRDWVQAQIFEREIGFVCVGQSIEATVEAYTGEVFKGAVAFLDPALNPGTRTLNVRYDLPNADGRLRPGMFATVTLRTLVAESPAFRNRLARLGAPATSAAEQKTCPVTRLKLGAMGDPVPTEVDGRKVWTCCDACPPRIKASPAKYLARLDPAPVPPDGVLSVPESAVIDTRARTLV